VLDGHATIRALRKMNPEVKVIAVSGLMDPGKLDPSCEGSTTVLTKPYTPETLLNMIQAVLHPSAK
jgi:CheY-like chemotaxis protein